ncbi:MAG TPA: site-2 protease family protein, partial [Dissulfurispiraceae bacterium]|nr:site-2 protease family protein [Dissulfurispiraceae bacterium]
AGLLKKSMSRRGMSSTLTKSSSASAEGPTMAIEDIIQRIAVSALPILIAITFHEVAHGFIAYKLGDPTAKMMGRLTLNPLAHIDPWGTLLMPGLLLVLTNGQFVFGYAKPVPINPSYFKNPRRDMALSAAGGPVTNILLAFVSLILLKIVSVAARAVGSDASILFTPLTLMLNAGVIINVVLAAFNLLPIPPLDGGRILMGFLPRQQAAALEKLEPYGFLIVITLVATGLSDYIVVPIIKAILVIMHLF